MLTEQYIQIVKEEFPYLFTEYGFKSAYSYQGEGRDLGRYAFGVESDTYKVRMLFSRPRGGGSIYIGRIGPYNYEESCLWFGAWNVIEFLDGKPVNWEKIEKSSDEDRIRPACRLISERFYPHCPRILEMFSSEEVIASWKPAYDKCVYQNPDTRQYAVNEYEKVIALAKAKGYSS